MAGYYDDFLGAVSLPDDLNEPSLTYESHKSHAGNAITGYAPLNPRHAHAFVEREDGATGRFNNAVLTGGAQYKMNAGIHEWLGYDQNRRAAETYVGKAQLQFPDSITNANRQKYNAGADYGTIPVEGYIMFCNGYDTSARYFAAIGSDDATFGRDDADAPDRNSSGTLLNNDAGIPVNASTPSKHIRTHVAGVYSGEVVEGANITNGLPEAYLYPIKSPSGGNFLVTEIYTTSATYDPVLAYDGTLNSCTLTGGGLARSSWVGASSQAPPPTHTARTSAPTRHQRRAATTRERSDDRETERILEITTGLRWRL